MRCIVIIEELKQFIKRVPVLGDLARRLYGNVFGRRKKLEPFPGTTTYWQKRYLEGGNSGVGSYTFFAEFKAEILNTFVNDNQVQTVIEFGCGDGNQLRLASYPKYLGFDISSDAIAECRKSFESEPRYSFKLMSEYSGERSDLSLSLDVVYHLVEDDVFEEYMVTLFKAANRYVIIYSSNSNNNKAYEGTHVKHRKFTDWVDANMPEWELVEHLPNRFPYRGDYRTGSFADFYIYRHGN